MPTFRRSLDVIFREVLPVLKPIGNGATGAASPGAARPTTQVSKTETTKSPLLVDLGSGDGRVVIEAARHGYRAVGCELNPVLVVISQAWALFDEHVAPRLPRSGADGRSEPVTTSSKPLRIHGSPWPSTGSARFECSNLWTLDLSEADVVMVYGLSPIMDRLGAKLRKELKPDALVISNVFQLDDAHFRKLLARDEVHVYAARDSKVKFG